MPCLLELGQTNDKYACQCISLHWNISWFLGFSLFDIMKLCYSFLCSIADRYLHATEHMHNAKSFLGVEAISSTLLPGQLLS